MEKRFTVVKTTRVVSLSGLKTLSFPLTELFYDLPIFLQLVGRIIL
jgi:Asp-tRNA(Asn)/Glu-tRNA(Gln) amidotransferase A subunit family amidase